MSFCRVFINHTSTAFKWSSIYPEGKYFFLILSPISLKCSGNDTCLYINKLANRRLKSVSISGYFSDVSLNNAGNENSYTFQTLGKILVNLLNAFY